ncbi:MAG TPA: SgcJ/EcaC family oxidoreductase [Steroidobacteraceae bacterium]|nr:SgcJ/EcaC family oxidoreductase [Steroidobacteraceae bacterium]
MLHAMRRSLWFGFLLACVSCGLAAAHADELAQVAAASRAWDEAYAAGDADRLADRYDAEAVSMPPGLPALVSRAAIAADFKTFFAAHSATHRTYEAVREIAGGLAVERARYEATITPRTGGEALRETGKHIVVYRRQADGSWKVLWEIWNQDG